MTACTKNFLILIIVLFLTGTTISKAQADCANPAGTEGLMDYFTADKTFKFCDGTSWQSMKGGGAGIWLASGNDIHYSSGNVGIGTTSPSNRLHILQSVAGATGATLTLQNNFGNSGSDVSLELRPGNRQALIKGIDPADGDDSGTELGFYTLPSGQGATIAATERLRIKKDGNVGIGTTAPNYKLQIAGISAATAFRFSSTADAGTTLCRGGDAGDGYYQITFCTSLAKYKDDVRDLHLGLETVMKMRPVSFTWKKEQGGYRDLGFIAEEIEKVDPLMAEYRDGKLQGVKYKNLTAVLTKAIQEQQNAIAALKSDVATLNEAKAEFEAYKKTHP